MHVIHSITLIFTCSSFPRSSAFSLLQDEHSPFVLSVYITSHAQFTSYTSYNHACTVFI